MFGKIAATVVTLGVLPKQNTTPRFTGFKNDDFMKVGYVYAPYIPMYRTHTVMTKDGIFNL